MLWITSCSPLRVSDLLGLVSNPREALEKLAVYALGTIQNACNRKSLQDC